MKNKEIDGKNMDNKSNDLNLRYKKRKYLILGILISIPLWILFLFLPILIILAIPFLIIIIYNSKIADTKYILIGFLIGSIGIPLLLFGGCMFTIYVGNIDMLLH